MLLIQMNSIFPFVPVTEIYFDGQASVYVLVQNANKGAMCGLCGDFNGDRTNDKQGFSNRDNLAFSQVSVMAKPHCIMDG